jgi:hypothetical protein
LWGRGNLVSILGKIVLILDLISIIDKKMILDFMESGAGAKLLVDFV